MKECVDSEIRDDFENEETNKEIASDSQAS